MLYQITHTHLGEFESKGSRFLAYLAPYALFDSLMSDLKKQHPKAVHFVYATRFYQNQILESFSDDGEPKGSSGIPTLNVLRGEHLINVGVIVVRYFGGTLLGVGGLVRAYTQATQETIKQAKEAQDLILYEHLVHYEIEVTYTFFNQIQYWISQMGIEICQKDFQAQSIKLSLVSTEKKKQEFCKRYEAKRGLY